MWELARDKARPVTINSDCQAIASRLARFRFRSIRGELCQIGPWIDATIVAVAEDQLQTISLRVQIDNPNLRINPRNLEHSLV
jgi:hypothetical protein